MLQEAESFISHLKAPLTMVHSLSTHAYADGGKGYVSPSTKLFWSLTEESSVAAFVYTTEAARDLF